MAITITEAVKTEVRVACDACGESRWRYLGAEFPNIPEALSELKGNGDKVIDGSVICSYCWQGYVNCKQAFTPEELDQLQREEKA